MNADKVSIDLSMELSPGVTAQVINSLSDAAAETHGRAPLSADIKKAAHVLELMKDIIQLDLSVYEATNGLTDVPAEKQPLDPTVAIVSMPDRTTE